MNDSETRSIVAPNCRRKPSGVHLTSEWETPESETPSHWASGARARPAEAPLGLIRGRHRFRILAKSPRGYDLSAYLRDWLAKAPKKKATSSSRWTSTRRAFCDEVARHRAKGRSQQ
jgi:hypothetical protein